MAQTDSTNTSWLKAYVARWGWPTAAQVGGEAVQAAFLIVQHAVHDTAVMRAMLPAIEQAHHRGELQGDAVAMLTDRLEVEGTFAFTSMFRLAREDVEMTVEEIRNEAVVTLRAILEMAKLRLIAVSQHEGDDEIWISRATEDIRAVLIAADPDRFITGMQMVQRRWDGKDGLILRLGYVDEPPAELTGRLIDAVYAARPLYPLEVEDGTIHHLIVEWVGRAELVTNPRTGKLMQVIDERPHTD